MASFKMGKVVLRSLFNKPATLMYPVIPREYTPITKGHITIEEEKCIVCGICQKKCPTNAITIDKAARTWSISRMNCIQCSCCAWACPKDALHMDPQYTAPNTVKVVDTFQAPPKEEKKAAPKTDAAV